jgi:hypothetical protein
MNFLDEKIWKMLFVEEICISQVSGQGFKGIYIHSKFTIPNWTTISFPLILWNRVCFKIVKVLFVTMYLWQAPTIKKKIWDWLQCGVPHMWIQIFFNAYYFKTQISHSKIFCTSFIYLGQGIGIWNIFLGTHTSTPFKVLELLMLNHRGSC